MKPIPRNTRHRRHLVTLGTLALLALTVPGHPMLAFAALSW